MIDRIAGRRASNVIPAARVVDWNADSWGGHVTESATGSWLEAEEAER